MSWTLVEPCCGAASLATHMSEVHKRTLLPYQGSKWKLRLPLRKILAERGYTGPPATVILSDIGPWGTTWEQLLLPEARGRVIALLKQWGREDPQKVHDRLAKHEASKDPATYAAEYLYLQRLAFGGKSMSVRDGIWKSPGFNAGAAYGIPATGKFGAISPMIPSLIRTLEEFVWKNSLGWRASQGDASAVQFPEGPQTVVYLDPPYEGTTPYPNGNLSRAEVVRLAQEWDKAGAFVIISEAEAVHELGWESRCWVGESTTDSPLRGNSPEWVTFNRAVRPSTPVGMEAFLGL